MWHDKCDLQIMTQKVYVANAYTPLHFHNRTSRKKFIESAKCCYTWQKNKV
jgi:hypothetical protein